MKRAGWIVWSLAVWVPLLSACTVVEPRPVVVEQRRVVQETDFVARMDNQQRRIDKGIASGALTRPEAAVLQDNLNWIRNRYARLTADGLLTPNEMNALDRMLEQNSRMIQEKKRNPVQRLY